MRNGRMSSKKHKECYLMKSGYFTYYNYGCKGHLANKCRSPPIKEANTATSQEEEPWDLKH